MKTKALSKWRQKTILLWGAEISVMIFRRANSKKIEHYFKISHKGSLHSGTAVNILPKLSGNCELSGISQSMAPKDMVGGQTTFTIENPKKGDTFLVEPDKRHEVGFFSTIFTFTGYRWKPLRRISKYENCWGTFSDCFFSLQLCGNVDVAYLQIYKYKGIRFDLYFSEGSTALMRQSRSDMLDFLVGRKSVAELLKNTFCRLETFFGECETKGKIFYKQTMHLKDEIKRLRFAGIIFAERIWKARSVSKSEAFAEPRRKFEAALYLRRIEEGDNKGTIVEISLEEAAEILGVKVEKKM